MMSQTYPKKPLSDTVKSPEKDKLKRMYQIHKYWARKPWYVVAEYIRHFSRKGEVVLDPFCGSGVTGIEAIAQDRIAYLVDLNPIATFITKATAMVDFNPYELKSAFGKIAAKCQKRIQELYSLDQKCSICNGELETRHILRGPKFKIPIVQAYCSHCGRKENLRRELTPKELDFLESIEDKPISAWYPEVPFPDNFDKDRVTYKGIKYVHSAVTGHNYLNAPSGFSPNGLMYGSCDACWCVQEEWTDPLSGESSEIRPVIAVEGTLALERGSSGNAQYQRFFHALGAVMSGVIGVYYLREGKDRMRDDLPKAALNAGDKRVKGRKDLGARPGKIGSIRLSLCLG